MADVVDHDGQGGVSRGEFRATEDLQRARSSRCTPAPAGRVVEQIDADGWTKKIIGLDFDDRGPFGKAPSGAATSTGSRGGPEP